MDRCQWQNPKKTHVFQQKHFSKPEKTHVFQQNSKNILAKTTTSGYGIQTICIIILM